MSFDGKSSLSTVMLLAGFFPRMLVKCILQEERHKIKEGLTQAIGKQYEIENSMKSKLNHNGTVV